MERWIERGRAQHDRFELFWLDGRWPADMLDDVVALSHVMNDAPFDDLEFNDQAFTTTHVVSEEDEIFERGFTRYTAAVTDRETGRMVGYTQMFINPSFLDLGQQGDTGVLEEYRGNRLGKWLKAEVARYLVDHHPEITRLRTSNASSNDPMLAINEEMGFTPHHRGTIWQKPTAEVLAADPHTGVSTGNGSSAT
jgi:GNAT superfamily N-acetyltransferase